MINAHLEGADILYAGAISDHPQIILFGKKGMTSLADLKGKTIAIGGSQGTSKDIFIHQSAKQAGLVVGRDVQLLFNPSGAAAVATFEAGNAESALLSPPETTTLLTGGYPVLVDYPKEGLKLVEPGVIVTRSFFSSSPNTIKAYLMGLYDGIKRAVDDPAYAKQVEGKASKITDAKVLDTDYQLGLKLWNRNMAIDQRDIQLVLDNIDDPKAKAAKPQDFFDNALVGAVNRDYAWTLFPNDVK
jgi:ABC-type nitrate/sulfonate/bicarbonate transport system substrate-binding protein